MPVIVSPEALADLASIQAYMTERNLVAAFALTPCLSDAMLSLEDMPLRGRSGWSADFQLSRFA